MVYSLPIPSNREIIRDYPKSSMDMPALNLEPSGTWNYALVATEAGMKMMKVIKKTITENPWNLTEVPLRIQVPARRIKDWKMSALTDSLSGSQQVYTLERNIYKGKFSVESVGDYLPGNVPVTHLNRLSTVYMNKCGCNILKHSAEDTHRRNITGKLEIKSFSWLDKFALTDGLIV